MTTLNNEKREEDVVIAVPAANPTDLPPKTYEALLAPYLVWAAIYECEISCTKHMTVSEGLLHIMSSELALTWVRSIYTGILRLWPCIRQCHWSHTLLALGLAQNHPHRRAWFEPVLMWTIPII